MTGRPQPVPDRAEVEAAIGDVARANGAKLALLFGSYARGTQTRRSDVDVIFVQETAEPFLDRLRKYVSALWDRLHVPAEAPRPLWPRQGR